MRTLKLALAAVAAFAFNANAQNAPVTGMGNGGTVKPPDGYYQTIIEGVGAADKGGVSFGFHAGGVAACDGCHVMHNASGGVAKSTAAASAVAPWSNVTNMYLLQGTDQSSTCLICHSGLKSVGQQFTIADVTSTDAPTNRTPGGDFGWVKIGFTGSPADRHGHNVVAADFGMNPDQGSMLTAPGGTWTGGAGKAAFACSSCHDPHGRYRVQNGGSLPNGYGFAGPFPGALTPSLPIGASGSYGTEPTGDFAVGAYRLLAGQRYAPASNSAFPFPNNPPFAVAPPTYNQAEDTVANEVIVAYGTGMSEWCQNCHTNIHLDGYTSGVASLRHPAGSDAKFHTGQIDTYNKYVSSGVMTGTQGYTSLVPFELGATLKLGDLSKFANKAVGSIIVANETSTVMCLSCHRAHASGFDSMVRWDQNATFLTDSDSYTNGIAVGRTTDQTAAGYNGRPYTMLGKYQRSMCNKCHGKD